MFTLFVIALCLAGLCAVGWILAELELRDTRGDLVEAEWDRDMALGWAETQVVENAVVHPSLHLVDRGEA